MHVIRLGTVKISHEDLMNAKKIELNFNTAFQLEVG